MKKDIFKAIKVLCVIISAFIVLGISSSCGKPSYDNEVNLIKTQKANHSFISLTSFYDSETNIECFEATVHYVRDEQDETYDCLFINGHVIYPHEVDYPCYENDMEDYYVTKLYGVEKVYTEEELAEINDLLKNYQKKGD